MAFVQVLSTYVGISIDVFVLCFHYFHDDDAFFLYYLDDDDGSVNEKLKRTLNVVSSYFTLYSGDDDVENSMMDRIYSNGASFYNVNPLWNHNDDCVCVSESFPLMKETENACETSCKKIRRQEDDAHLDVVSLNNHDVPLSAVVDQVDDQGQCCWAVLIFGSL
jgi:hypothetical protein